MKKSLRLFNSAMLVLMMMLIASHVGAQKTASVSGPWNVNATWGGATPPTAADDVIINNGVTVTVPVAASCASLTINGGATATGITVNTGFSLNVTTASGGSGAVVVNAGTDGTSARTITLTTTGTLTCVSLTMADVAPGNSASTLAIGAGGSATVSSSIALNGAAGAENFITIAANGSLNIGGTVSATGGAINPAIDGYVNYNGAAQTIRSQTYDRLTLSGSGVKTLPATLTINDDLNLDGSASVTTANTLTVGNDLNLSGTASLTTGANFTVTDVTTVGAGTSLTIGAFNFTNNGDVDLSGTLTINGGTSGTKTFNGLVSILSGGVWDNTVNEGVTFNGGLDHDGATFNAGTGVQLFDADQTISGATAITIPNLTVNSGTDDLTNTADLTITASLAGSGELINAAAGNLKINFGGAIGITTLTATAAGNIVNYMFAGAQTIRATTYSTLILSGSGDKTFSAVTATTINALLSMQGTAIALGGTPTYNAAAILEYKGSAAQNTSDVEFGGTGANPSRLRIDNANGVTLNATKTINTALTLTTGNLITTTTNLLILADNATSSAGTNSSYVSGPLRKVGNDAFTFPVGKGGLYSPVTISAPNNTGDIFQAEYRRESATALGPINAAISSSIYHVSNCEYWDLDEIADAGTANSINITMGWFSGSGCGPVAYVTDYTQLRLVHFDDVTTNTWNSFGGTPTGSNTTGTITMNAVTVFSPFALGSAVLTGNPLPVKFSDVKAFEKGTGVQIEWTNQTEENIANYIVERSSNGVDFSVVVSTVAARSNMSDKQSYVAYDAAPLNGANFYRVRAIEFDGKQVYSKSLKVEIGRSPKGITLYPNPVVGNEMSIGFSGMKGQYNLRVFNAAGQEVFAQRISHQGGNVTQTVSLPSSVRPGVYNLLIAGDNYKESKMFVLQ